MIEPDIKIIAVDNDSSELTRIVKTFNKLRISCFPIEYNIGTYSGAYPFTFRQPIKHKIAFKSTILYPFIP